MNKITCISRNGTINIVPEMFFTNNGTFQDDFFDICKLASIKDKTQSIEEMSAVGQRRVIDKEVFVNICNELGITYQIINR